MAALLRVWLTILMMAGAQFAAQASLMDGFSLEELEYGRSASDNADFARGHDAFDKGDILKAIEAFKQAADAGDVKAQTNVGILYLFGDTLLKEGEQIENSDEQALKYFNMAGAQGDGAAYHRIGYMHDPLIGARLKPISMEEAIKWYRKAAALGYGPAKEDLYGIYTSDGRFNLEEALKWTDWRAAYEGDADAQFKLAVLYWRGSSLDGDLKENEFNTGHQITALKWIIVVQENEDKALVKELLGDDPNMYNTILENMKNPDIHKAVMLARACVDSKFKNCETPGPGPKPGATAKPTPTGDWYAVAGAFKKRGQAQGRADRLGAGWSVMNTGKCPNFRDGYWIAANGPASKKDAMAHASGASKFKAYAKACH